MALPLYLALTQAEFQNAEPLSGKIAWMACHFSPYGTGLCDLPSRLPKASAVILDDCIPVGRHDAKTVAGQLAAQVESVGAEAVLLDFQREGCEAAQEIAKRIVDHLPCPVGVSERYAEGLNCPVFLPPIPPDMDWDGYFAPYEGREIWLEVSTQAETVVVTGNGATVCDGREHKADGFKDEELLCRYCMEIAEDQAVFTLWRSEEDIQHMRERIGKFGVTRLFGLYQELG